MWFKKNHTPEETELLSIHATVCKEKKLKKIPMELHQYVSSGCGMIPSCGKFVIDTNKKRPHRIEVPWCSEDMLLAKALLIHELAHYYEYTRFGNFTHGDGFMDTWESFMNEYFGIKFRVSRETMQIVFDVGDYTYYTGCV